MNASAAKPASASTAPRLLAVVSLAAILSTMAPPAWAEQDAAQGAASAAQTNDSLWDVRLATEWSRGHYGDTVATRIRQTGMVLRHRRGAFDAELEVPWLRIDTEGATAGLPGSVGQGPEPAEGLGDIWLKLSWAAQELDADTPGMDLTLKIKTASGEVNKGLGTGGTDYALQWGGAARLSASTLLFGHLGWRHTGDVAGYTPYRDPWYAEIGAQSLNLQPLDIGAYYDTRQAIGRLGPLKELTAFCGWRHESRRMQIYLTRGFAKASPQWALGLSARQRF